MAQPLDNNRSDEPVRFSINRLPPQHDTHGKVWTFIPLLIKMLTIVLFGSLSGATECDKS